MLENMTIAQLKTLVSDMNLRSQNGDMKVTSKMRKADIIEMIMAEIDRLHDEAMEMNDTRDIVKIAETGSYLTPVKSERKSYSQRMISRCEGYARQNGHEYSGFIGDMIARFTPAQRRRYNKKVRAFNAR